MGLSRPARALWIEIKLACNSIKNHYWVEARVGLVDRNSVIDATSLPPGKAVSRPARALWIEIQYANKVTFFDTRRGPRGPCGLKSVLMVLSFPILVVEAREGLVD